MQGADQAVIDRTIADYGSTTTKHADFTEEHFNFAWDVISKLHELIAELPEKWPNDAEFEKLATQDLSKKAREIWTRAKS